MQKSFVYLSLIVGLLLISTANLKLGAVNLSWYELWRPSDSAHQFTLYDYRLPRVILALIVGAFLGVSGALVQGVVRNPLASPDILGISHGAGLAAVCFMLYVPNGSVYFLPWVALAGGLLAAGILLVFCRRLHKPIEFALTGIALSALLGSVIDFLMLTQKVDINQALLWLTGSLWGRGWAQVALLLPWCLLLPLAIACSKRLDLYAIGDEKAVNLGVKVNKTRLGVLLLSVLLTSVSVAVCGPLAFLGLVAPHIARRVVGGNHFQLILTSMLVGSLLLLLADLLARNISPPLEIPAGIMTAMLGAPYFLYLLSKMK